MDIDVKLLKELRERTGAGIMDCKKALEQNDSDIEKASSWLREKGIAKAVKKAARISAEGVFNIVENGNEAIVYEVNCETDFVASNAKFKDFVAKVGEVLKNHPEAVSEETALATKEGNETIQDMVLGFIAVIGEKITLRNVCRINKNPEQIFGIYKHNGGKIAVVSILDGSDVQVGKHIAMQVCAQNPLYLDRTHVDAEYLAKEKEIITKEAQENNPGKPANIIEKMVEGRINKELKEVCLVDQALVVDPNLTVGQYLKNNNMVVKSYFRFVAGEGIEKKGNDFVNEVMSQMKK